MKKLMLKSVVCILVLCLMLPVGLSGCAGRGKTLISLDDHKLSVNIYQLMLTLQKGSMAYSIYTQYGNYNSEKFWGMTVDKATQKTNAQYYDELVLERAKNYLCAMALFDELSKTKADFNFPKKYENNIDAAIESMIEVDAGGSKTKLNSILSEYGINIDMLRDYLLMDAKAIYVMEYLYGSDGSKIGDAVKEEYYNENYVSCKQIQIQKFYYLYETDKDGNVIYFSTETGYPVYDKTKTPAYNKDGTSVVDEHGAVIYYNDDGSVAYDTVNGEKKILTDELTGETVYKMYSTDKINQLREEALLLTAEADGKGINAFEALRMEHSDDYDPDDGTGGVMFYDTSIDFSAFTSDFFDEISGSLANMETGDVKLLESDLVFSIIIKTDLEPGAWAEEKYSGFFEDNIYGVTDFNNNLKEELYSARLALYSDRIKIDESALADIDFSISNVVPNYYYPDPDVAYYLFNEQ